MYVKIHEQIFGSSIMEVEVEIRYIWLCLLTLADKEGFIDMTIPSIARRINISEDKVSKAIDIFTSPDKSSRTPDSEGRRLEKIRDSFGWQVVNYIKYSNLRDEEARREQNREAQRRHRAKTVSKQMSADVSKCQQRKPKSANTDTDTDTDTDTIKENYTKEKVLPDWLDKKIWNDYLEMRKKLKKPLTEAGIVLAIKKLEKLKELGNDTKGVLEQSIYNSWQGLFEIKKENYGKQPGPGKYANVPYEEINTDNL